MKWKVEGHDRNTGKRMRAVVRAKDEAQARRRAERAGMTVASAVQMEPEPELVRPRRVHIDAALAYSPHYVAPAGHPQPPRRLSLLSALRNAISRRAQA